MKSQMKRYRYRMVEGTPDCRAHEEVWDWNRISPDYLPSDGDDDLIRTIKESLIELSEAERKIMIAYCECGTYVGVARLFHSSAPTVRKYIRAIRRKLWENCY